MPAMLMVSAWRPSPGKLSALMEAFHQAKKVHERLGGQVQMWQTQVGGEPQALLYGVRFENGKEYGTFIDKLEADAEWQRLMSGWTGADPPMAALVRNSTLSQIA
jgi:hypothetical protein